MMCAARIRANPRTAMLPVVMVTALDPAQERVKGIEAGADDFLSKPINQPELLARVRSLLRIKTCTTRCSAACQLATGIARSSSACAGQRARSSSGWPGSSASSRRSSPS